MRAADVKVVPARTVVLPATVEAYELDSEGTRAEDNARAKALEKTIAAEFERQARAKGALPLSFDSVRTSCDSCVSLLSTSIRWGAKAAMEIAEANSGSNPSGRSSVAEWQSARNLQLLQRAMGADFTLVFFVRDSHWTFERQFREASKPVLLRAIQGNNHDSFRRILVACALELASGRMVWCSSIVDRWTDQYVDVSSPAEARRLVEELLLEF